MKIFLLPFLLSISASSFAMNSLGLSCKSVFASSHGKLEVPLFQNIEAKLIKLSFDQFKNEINLSEADYQLELSWLREKLALESIEVGTGPSDRIEGAKVKTQTIRAPLSLTVAIHYLSIKRGINLNDISSDLKQAMARMNFKDSDWLKISSGKTEAEKLSYYILQQYVLELLQKTEVRSLDSHRLLKNLLAVRDL